MRNPLARYLRKHSLSAAAFADMVGAHRSQISRAERGERRPGLALAVKIEMVTGGAVPVASWTSLRSRSAA